MNDARTLADRMHVSRRNFLKGALAAGSATMLDARWLSEGAQAGPQLESDGRILVLIELNGGLDGLNTVVPFGDAAYAAQRGPLALAAGSLLPIADGVGLHPALSGIKSRYDNGNVAIVRGVGMPDGNRSHFDAMARVMAANPGEQPPVTGWAGRYLDGLNLGGLGGIAIETTGVPVILRGSTDTTTTLPIDGSQLTAGVPSQPHWTLTYDWMQRVQGQRWGTNQWYAKTADLIGQSVGMARELVPLYDGVPGDGTPLERSLAVAASLINLDVGARILHVNRIGFDTHATQAAPLESLLREFDAAIDAFYETLDPQFRSRIVLATITEFGRRVQSNGALGTDHGTSSVMFLIGSRVKGGLYGTQPSLTQLDSRGDLQVTTDVRSVFATTVVDWLGGDEVAIFGRSYGHLPLFRSGPACAPLPSQFSSVGYRPLMPQRVLDTRLGVGAPKAVVGPGQTIVLDLAGRGGVPSTGVAAVAMNVTATDADTASYLTVWPSDRERPDTSNLNLEPGFVTPNLVISRVDGNGRVSIFNQRGSTHIVADVAGWIPVSSPYVAVQPARVLDTRTGVWSPRARLAGGQTMRMTLAGRFGVGPDAEAVVLNLTAVDSDASGFVTVWPSGTERPYVSSLNTEPNRAIPNLVIARLGNGGAVDLFVSGGATHLIADVFGWFPPNAGFHPVTPTRLLDTRYGITARGAMKAKRRLDVAVSCESGIPANAAAVALNVTVTSPTDASYLTVWPAGSPQPNSSNLNYVAGQTVPNLVICKLGVDGMISLANANGAAHAVADLIGWFE